MPKQEEVQRNAYRIKPKHHANVRGLEYKEGETVELSLAEFNESCDLNCGSRFIPETDYAQFMADFAAGVIDHTGKPIPKVQEAEGQIEAGQ